MARAADAQQLRAQQRLRALGPQLAGRGVGVAAPAGRRAARPRAARQHADVHPQDAVAAVGGGMRLQQHRVP
ncbi:hypothetical protein RZS08_28905, partial [Arthrospira platensis SPKY1]|nr:hypothetical protein [Arthrospira platensis SPKY1]